ncbi:hypothetical protein HYW18_01300 [Candidatus Uhrbacteria bacterium]|nr:hypothetical protein [Candidatus Uhrbacteria bacterium]
MSTFSEILEHFRKLGYRDPKKLARIWQMAVSVRDVRRLHDIMPEGDQLLRHDRRLLEKGWEDYTKTRPKPWRRFDDDVAKAELSEYASLCAHHPYYARTIVHAHMQERKGAPHPRRSEYWSVGAPRPHLSIVQRSLEPHILCDAFTGYLAGVLCQIACLYNRQTSPAEFLVEVTIDASCLTHTASTLLLPVLTCEDHCLDAVNNRLEFRYIISADSLVSHLKKVERPSGRVHVVAEPGFAAALEGVLRENGLQTIEQIKLVLPDLVLASGHEIDDRRSRGAYFTVDSRDPHCVVTMNVS